MRIVLFWYSKQTVCIKWGRCISGFFSISNGVRQGGILSLFSVYIDDLSDKLVKCKVGCYIDNLCMNHVMYADDICRMAPSPAALQELIDIYVMILVSKMIHLLILPNRIVWYLNQNRISCHVPDYIYGQPITEVY